MVVSMLAPDPQWDWLVTYDHEAREMRFRWLSPWPLPFSPSPQRPFDWEIDA